MQCRLEITCTASRGFVRFWVPFCFRSQLSLMMRKCCGLVNKDILNFQKITIYILGHDSFYDQKNESYRKCKCCGSEAIDNSFHFGNLLFWQLWPPEPRRSSRGPPTHFLFFLMRFYCPADFHSLLHRYFPKSRAHISLQSSVQHFHSCWQNTATVFGINKVAGNVLQSCLVLNFPDPDNSVWWTQEECEIYQAQMCNLGSTHILTLK